jgi:hypothetical protein
MKRLLLIFCIGTALGLGGWYYGVQKYPSPGHSMIQADSLELAWLRDEYQLSPVQFDKIKKLHEDYAPICAQLCERVIASQSRLEVLITGQRELTPEFAAALHESAQVKNDCQTHLLAHLYRVAAEMNPASATRYLERMKTRVSRPGLTH